MDGLYPPRDSWHGGTFSMRNLLAFLAAAVLAFLGLGWYLGWYTFRSVPTEAGHRGYTIDINSQKIEKDVQKGVRSGEEKLHDVLDNAKTTEATTTADKKTTPSGSDALNGLRSLPRLLIEGDDKTQPANSSAKPPSN
jgi:hypothetical protein